MIIKGLLLFVMSSLQFFCSAQDHFYTHYQAFDEQNGYKVFEGANYLTEDNKGLLWIGSDNGLISFDGTHFRNYRHISNDSLSLPGNRVLYNYQDAEGKYWTAISGQGLYHFDPLTRSFQRFQYSNQNEFNIHQYQIGLPTETKEAVLWFPLPGFGIAAYHRQTNKLVPYKISPAGNCNTYYSASWITSIKEDPKNNTLWLATNNGLLHFFPNSGTYEIFQDDRPSLDVITTINFDKKQQLWVGTWGQGISRFDPGTKKFAQYKWSNSSAGTTNICSGIYPYESNQFWVASLDQGLLLFDPLTGKFRPVRSSSNKSKILIANNTMQSSKGALWLANQQALVRLHAAENGFIHYSLETLLHKTPNAHGIFSFLRQENTLVAGVYYEGNLITYDLATRRQKMHLLPAPANKKGIFCLSEDAQKNIWVGAVSGAYIFKPQTGNFIKPDIPLPADAPAYFILHSRNGKTWLASKKGLLQYDATTKNAQWFSYDTTTADQLRTNNVSNRIYTLYEDSQGNIWFGNNSLGLGCYRQSNGKIYYFNQSRNRNYPDGNCSSISEAKDGSILFSIENTGLCMLKFPFTAKESMTVLNSSNGLPSDNVSSVFTDRDQNIWLFTSNGLSLFNLHKQQTITFGKADGLAQTNLSSTPYQDSAGNIYMGFADEFQTFQPHRLLQPTRAMGPLHLASLKINSEEWPVNPDYLSSLNLNHQQTNIAFDFAVLAPDQTTNYQYAYKLDGLEKAWNYTNGKTFGQYNNLAPGKYTLRIRAADRSGRWNKSEWALPLTIHPAWYGTWWFYTLLAALSVTLLYLLYRFRIRQILKLQAMRTQIASDLHDEIGSTLTSISFQSEMIKMQLGTKDEALKELLDKVGGNARSATRAMSDIVWVINPANDLLENLLARMKSHTAELCSERNIAYNFDITETKQRKLNMLQRKNIYLIYKEALHNAVKYSGCSSIRINFIHTESDLKLSIRDNGSGFEPAKVKGHGNGLENMKRRAVEIQANIAIEASPGNGTLVNLHLKLT